MPTTRHRLLSALLLTAVLGMVGAPAASAASPASTKLAAASPHPAAGTAAGMFQTSASHRPTGHVVTPHDCEVDCGGGCTHCQPPPPAECVPHLTSQGATRGQSDDVGAYSHVSFSSNLYCQSVGATSIHTELWDRTDGDNGRVLATGSGSSGADLTISLDSSGAIDLPDVYLYPWAQQVEQVMIVDSDAGPAAVWTACNTLPDYRVLSCDGLGSRYLHAAIGFYPFNTGVSPAPFNCLVQANMVVANGAVTGNGTINCNYKANLTVSAKLSYSTDGKTWTPVGSPVVMSYTDVAKNTTKATQVTRPCDNGAPARYWRVDVHGQGVIPGWFWDTISSGDDYDRSYIAATC